MNEPDPIPGAIKVFARGFCFTRSLTHRYIPDRIGPLWVMRDGSRPGGDYRNEQWISYRVPPADVDRIVRRHTRGRFAVCAIQGINEPDDALRAGFKSLGYRLMTTEPLMVHSLRRIRRFDSPATIQRVTTLHMAARLGKATRRRPLLAEHLADHSPCRQYVALIDENPVGWVQSIVAGDATWCSNMYVVPKFRRRGIARAMLGRMLRDDRARGATAAVLLASHTGAKLYPLVGYERIGTLLMFTPGKRPGRP